MKLTFVILCTLSMLIAEAPGLTHQMGWFSFGLSSTTNNQNTSVTPSNSNNTIPTSSQNITLATANTTTINSTKSLTTTSSSSYSYLRLLNPFYWLSGSTNSTVTSSSSTSGLSPLSILSFRKSQPEQQDVAKRMDAADDPTIGPFQSNRIVLTTTIAPTQAIQEVPIKRTNTNSSMSSNLQPRLLPSHHHLNHQTNRPNVDTNSTSTVLPSPSPRPVATIKATLVTNSSSMRSSYMLNGNNNNNGSSISNMFTTSRPNMSRSMGGLDVDTHSLIRQKTPKMMFFVRKNGQNHLVHNNNNHHHVSVNQTTSLTTQAPTAAAPPTSHVSSLTSTSDSNNQNPLVLVVMPSPVASEESATATTNNNGNNKVIAHDHNTSSIAT